MFGIGYGDYYWQVYWDLTREVKLRFDREGISIPFPQCDVHPIPTPDEAGVAKRPNDTARGTATASGPL